MVLAEVIVSVRFVDQIEWILNVFKNVLLFCYDFDFRLFSFVYYKNINSQQYFRIRFWIPVHICGFFISFSLSFWFI